MILGADLVQQLSKRYVHSPSDIFPVLPHRAKFNWFRALPTIRLGDSDSRDPSIYEGKYQVTRRDFSHRLVEWVARAIGVALRRPEVATCDLLAECLILVDPPISHPDSAVRDKPGFPFLGSCPANEDTPYALSLKCSTDTNAVNPAVLCGREFLLKIQPALWLRVIGLPEFLFVRSELG